MEYDFPEPVCPYAKRQQLYPYLCHYINLPSIRKDITADRVKYFALIIVFLVNWDIYPIWVNSVFIMRPKRVIVVKLLLIAIGVIQKCCISFHFDASFAS